MRPSSPNATIKLIILICLASSGTLSQTKIDPIYQKLTQIDLFKSDKKMIGSTFQYSSIEESISGGFHAIDYELDRAKLTVYYSSGDCSEHGSSLGYDVSKDTVIGLDLFYNSPRKLEEFEFDLKKFRKYVDTEGNSTTYTNDEDGIRVTGGDDRVMSLEIFPTALQEKTYRCGTK